MPRPRIALHRPIPPEVSWEELRAELQVPGEFPPEVLAEAEAAAAAPRLPDLDLTDRPFFTIDPAGSLDLDQAMHLARARCDGADLPLGERVPVRLAVADPVKRQVLFQRT